MYRAGERQGQVHGTNWNGSYAGKFAFITGVGSGIGRSTTMVFANALVGTAAGRSHFARPALMAATAAVLRVETVVAALGLYP